MMRALYSGVSGLKTHQTKMDVIGNNIANVNTTAFKSQSITFSELMYQTTQAASGANTQTRQGRYQCPSDRSWRKIRCDHCICGNIGLFSVYGKSV